MAKYCYKCMEPLEGERICPHCGQPARAAATALPYMLAPGSMLNDRYLVGDALGQGGFGITYIGRDTMLDMRVAIKEYCPSGFAGTTGASLSADSVTTAASTSGNLVEEGRARFLQEARSLARFDGNRGIVGVRDFFEASGTAYIIMEYLDGRDLREHLEESLFTAEETFKLVDPVFDVLEKIHAAGVIHRDISPDNIMILTDGSLKLMDFGAARTIDYDAEKSISIMLKPGYAPEEQYRSRSAQGPWTDIYALCATMYKCITGVTPENSLSRVYEDEMKWPSELGIEITPLQEAVLKKGMAVRPEDRFQSVTELKAALAEGMTEGELAEAGKPVVSSAKRAPGKTSAKPKGGTGKVVAIVCGVVAVVAIALAAVFASGVFASESISFETMGGTAVESLEVKSGEEVPALPEPARDGYSFGGWFYDTACTQMVELPASFDESCTLYAQWLAQVDFVSERGTLSLDSAVVAAGSKLAAPTEPSAKNYTFKGWFADEACTQQVDFPLTVDEATTLYAGWSVNKASYTVRYLEQGTNNTLHKKKVVKDAAAIGKTVKVKALSISGYTLVTSSPKKIKLAASTKKNVVTFYYTAVVQETPSEAENTTTTNTTTNTNTNTNTNSNSGGDDDYANWNSGKEEW